MVTCAHAIQDSSQNLRNNHTMYPLHNKRTYLAIAVGISK